MVYAYRGKESLKKIISVFVSCLKHHFLPESYKAIVLCYLLNI